MAVGFSGVFERFMHRIPLPLASAMLAGVLLRLGMDVFVTMSQQWALPLLMTLVYLLARRWQARYAVVLSLFAPTALAAWQGSVDWRGQSAAGAFGAFALNLAAITAAICSSEEAHPDKSKRYTAAISAGDGDCRFGAVWHDCQCAGEFFG